MTAADGTEFPYAQDHEGIWHRRPVDDTWSVVPEEYSCSTVCGRRIVSAHVSPGHPLGEGNYSYTEADVCQDCEQIAPDTRPKPTKCPGPPHRGHTRGSDPCPLDSAPNPPEVRP